MMQRSVIRIDDTRPGSAVPAADEAPPLPYTTVAAARIHLSLQLYGLADVALNLADPTADHRRPGPLSAEAAGLVDLARFVAGIAVAADREAGHTWEELGALTKPRTPRQNMQRRHREDMAGWETIRDHIAGGIATTATRHADTAEKVHGVADLLYRRGQFPAPEDPQDPTPADATRQEAARAAVAAALPRHTPLSLLQALTRDESALLAAYAYPDPQQIAALAEARAAVYDRLAADHPGDGQTDQRRMYEGLAAMDRERAAAHRARPAEAVPYTSPRLAALPPAPPMYAEPNEFGRCRACDGTRARCQVCHQPRHDADSDHEPLMLPCRGCNGGAYPVRPDDTVTIQGQQPQPTP
ncbi:MAG: hypothetical protein AUG49_18935 [Catenulispora sp. 13_1_20CM_3_70_7]|nr:MAG: hypothetical protein AUG49_18935 [Catenulispora sp. 13_1_20CM_3_70_7]